MKFCVISFFFIFILSGQAETRNWYYGTGLDGKPKEFFGTTDMHSRFLNGKSRSVTFWENRLSVINNGLESVKNALKTAPEGPEKNSLIDKNYKLINDKARCLVYLKKADEALNILTKLEKVWSGESIVAENLAVCYDIKKDYAKALEWVQVAIKRNQMSLYSNLWVYEKILEARKEYEKDKNYLVDHSISGLIISQDKELKVLDLSRIENFQKRWSLAGKAKHIREQLKTQLELHDVEKDPIIAHLMEELGCIYAVNEVCEVALPVFELAQKYGHPEIELIANRISQMKSLIAGNERSMDYSRSIFEKVSKGAWILYSTIGVLILLLGYVWVTGKKRSVDS